jgi:hypothetical protein
MYLRAVTRPLQSIGLIKKSDPHDHAQAFRHYWKFFLGKLSFAIARALPHPNADAHLQLAECDLLVDCVI